MKVDVSQFRKRPTFQEVANIVNEDAYKIDLPQRTFIKFQDTQAAVEWQDFRDQSQEGEQLRIQRQVYEANQRAAMPHPLRQRHLYTPIALWSRQSPIPCDVGCGMSLGRHKLRKCGQLCCIQHSKPRATKPKHRTMPRFDRSVGGVKDDASLQSAEPGECRKLWSRRRIGHQPPA